MHALPLLLHQFKCTTTTAFILVHYFCYFCDAYSLDEVRFILRSYSLVNSILLKSALLILCMRKATAIIYYLLNCMHCFAYYALCYLLLLVSSM